MYHSVLLCVCGNRIRRREVFQMSRNKIVYRNDAGEIVGWDYEADAHELAEWDYLEQRDSIFEYDPDEEDE